MAFGKKNAHSQGCEIDMTPMIDVVFQLIIFFIVTINLEQNYNKDILLEDAPHARIINTQDEDPRTLIIEVDKRGWISLHGAVVNKTQLAQIVRRRFNAMGEYPVLIRGDKRTKHRDIRGVMDTCSGAGLWKITFAAIKEHKVKNGRR